jgi:hypothetical protein
MCAERLSPANTIASGMRVYILERRSSSAAAHSRKTTPGAAGDDLRELTPWDATSGPKPDVSAYDRFSKKKHKRKATGRPITNNRIMACTRTRCLKIMGA